MNFCFISLEDSQHTEEKTAKNKQHKKQNQNQILVNCICCFCEKEKSLKIHRDRINWQMKNQHSGMTDDAR